MREDFAVNRFVPVNAAELKRLRETRGWSQRELATKAGYTDRLIRKAEAGGSLDVETICNLAEALSVDGEVVSKHSIMADRLSMATQFIDAYDYYGPAMLLHVESILADNFVFHVPGDASSAPFCGDWYGTNGLREFLRIFFSMVSRTPGTLKTVYSVGNNTVSAKYVDTLFVPDQPPTVLWTNMHFYFEEGLIVRAEDQYDTKTASETKLPLTE